MFRVFFFSLCPVCVCFLNYCFFQVILFNKLKDMRGDVVAEVRSRRASIFSPTTLLKMAR